MDEKTLGTPFDGVTYLHPHDLVKAMAQEIKVDLTAKDKKTLDALLKKLQAQNPELDIQVEWVEEETEEEE